MKKIITLTLLFLSVMAAMADHFRIRGTYLHKRSGIATLLFYNSRHGTTLQADVRGGKFVMSGTISEPCRASLDNRDFWLSPSQMQVTLDDRRDAWIKVIGSKAQADEEEANRLTAGIKDRDKRHQALSSFIQSHPDSYLSLDYLSMLTGNEEISLQESHRIFSSMSEKVRTGTRGKDFQEMLRRMDNVQPGHPAPAFRATECSPWWLSHGGEQRLSLEGFRGKVVLMDFWYQGCYYCRHSFPMLRAFYDSVHDAGLEMLSVYFDVMRFSTSSWQEAIRLDSTEAWHHVNIAADTTFEKLTNDDIYSNYFVQAMPAYVVIDRQGIIRGHWVGADDQQYAEMKRLIRELLRQ